MSYVIARVIKVKSTAIGAMQYHNDRAPGEHLNPIHSVPVAAQRVRGFAL